MRINLNFSYVNKIKLIMIVILVNCLFLVVGLLMFFGIDVSNEVYDWIIVIVFFINLVLNLVIYNFIVFMRYKVCNLLIFVFV